VVELSALCDGKFGTVETESEWTARRREANKMFVSGPLGSPPFARKKAKDGAPPSVVSQTSDTERVGHPRSS
jgi:hypothetical protein